MAAVMIAESTCDRCGAVERREQAVTFTPSAWRIAQVGYMASNGFVPEQTRLLCDSCIVIVLVAMDPIPARAS